MLDQITQDIVGEALDNLEVGLVAMIKMRMSSEAERELAAIRLKQIEHAREKLTELMMKSPVSH